MFTDEVRNLSFTQVETLDTRPLLESRVNAPFWDLLDSLGISVVVSREYEHFVTILRGTPDEPRQSAMELPHPSGLVYDEDREELVLSSTRTPHQLLFLKPLRPADYKSEILPADFCPPAGTMFAPRRSLFLPGDFYLHDLVLIDGELYATVTGHNFVAKISRDGQWERAWWPACLDDLEDGAFSQNCLQLNSIAVGPTLDSSFFTAFSDQTTGAKPWKEGYGPRGKGVVFSGSLREVICGDLTCPHSAKLREDQVWLCNSGYGEVAILDPDTSDLEIVCRLPGFTRGLAFAGCYAFIGLSKVIPKYEPYAPGIRAEESQCGVAILDLSTGEIVAQLTWDSGYQIYDVQILPGYPDALLPSREDGIDDVNPYLRYLG